MDLLREGSEFSHYLYDCKITQEQLDQLHQIMTYYMKKVDASEEIPTFIQ